MAEQKSIYLKFIEQGLQVAAAIPKYFSRFSNKLFDNHQKLVLLVLRQKLRSTYRDLVELLKITNIPQMLGLKRIPHFTTLIRFSQRLSPLLASGLLAYSCRMTAPAALQLGVDATGFSQERGSEYYVIRAAKEIKQKKVMQVTACALLDKQMVSAVRIAEYKTVRNNNFRAVVRDSARLGTVEFVAADKGYDGNANHSFVMHDLHAQSLICSKPHLSKRNRIRKQARMQFDEQKYHQRSKIETIFSCIKRKYGATLRSKSPLTRRRESLQKVLAHNLDRLCQIIQRMILGLHQSWSIEFVA